ncbi:hypothetical protein [uncultured Ellagibacter sp.]|uniref:hypothetical protein n=1 Tax=uncultured Ellagibacter sp. TaxID=2137580 RepID=UPI0026282508|nr:hypothetical protein [uncultured Ellagibacter sp.]
MYELSCMRDMQLVARGYDLSILPKVARRAAKQQEAHTRLPQVFCMHGDYQEAV